MDLGATKPISRVDLYPRADAGSAGQGLPVDFSVQVSADKSTWTTVATRTGFATPGAGAQTFPFPTIEVRYVKVEGTKLSRDPHSHYRLQFAEIEVAGGNLAAGRAVSTSSSYEGDGWSRTALTDGQTRSALGYSMGWSSHGACTAHAKVDLAGPTRSVHLQGEDRRLLQRGAGGPHAAVSQWTDVPDLLHLRHRQARLPAVGDEHRRRGRPDAGRELGAASRAGVLAR
ncbi:discoidin domain-containing protein [Nonomuraea zeae]|uniref:Discoidin domain-containing protein n=1 Tax=Nonomuraea zeae TaxID=1642303 RepID=A0A5S4GG50_9ACTN|nr:discoidin domain-containing protein [Nonomuraea zeae]